jgi:dihydroorotase
LQILIKNARVIDPASAIDAVMDVLIDGAKIAGVGKNISAPAGESVEIVDAEGLVLAPGFIDMHTHLREPGFEHKETIRTGSRSGVKGGFCALVPMANTNPVTDNADVIKLVRERSKESALTHVYPVAAVTLGLEGKKLVNVAELKQAGAIALSDDGRPVVDDDLLGVALECAAKHDLPIISHCEDQSLAADGSMNEGEVSRRLGRKGIPAEAEVAMVRRDIDVLRGRGGRLHVAHVSCAGSVEIIRAARREGLAVTAETAPHYFCLTDEAVQKFGTNAKMNPPLRTAADVEAIRRGLKDGTIDAIATDHAPHSPEEKAADFAEAPFGIVGLETCLGLVMTMLVDGGVLSLPEAIATLTTAPAGILGLAMGALRPGARADITVFDPEAEFTVDANSFESKGRNSPFDGMRLKGKAIHTIVAGRFALRDGLIIE